MKKILVIPGGLQVGGAERIAANIGLYAPLGRFQFDYLVFENFENDYGPMLEARGCRVLTVPPPSAGYGAYCRRLLALMRENNYAAVHSHTMFNSGLNLMLAKVCGIPCRIAHSHTTRTETAVGIAQKLYEFAMRGLIRACATDFFACGQAAGQWMFGKVFERRGTVIKNGLELERFTFDAAKRSTIRQTLGAQKRFVIGHAGSLSSVKNQTFLIRLMPTVLKTRSDALLVLLGGGTARAELETLAEELGVTDVVHFTGEVPNVNEYLNAFDVFAFPSLREGTPLALLEAQANGLPCIVSDRIPADAFTTVLVRRFPLENPSMWVNALCMAQRDKPEQYAQALDKAGFDVRDACRPIYAAYEQA